MLTVKLLMPGGHMQIYIGCAGWTVANGHLEAFGIDDTTGGHKPSVLARYATVFNAVELNSSFYRLHMRKTYEKWAADVPADFKFSVKIPKTITHLNKLVDCADLLHEFWLTVAGLGEKLGALLIQLPPSLAFDADRTHDFFTTFKQVVGAHSVRLVCEPRHVSWFEDNTAGDVLKAFEVARVAADPAKVPAAFEPAGDLTALYYRLHGSPKMYYSSYGQAFLEQLARTVRAQNGRQVWVIFDNTASGAAIENAQTLRQLLLD